MIKRRFVFTVLMPVLASPICRTTEGGHSATLLLSITQKIPLNLTNVIDDVDPCLSH